MFMLSPEELRGSFADRHITRLLAVGLASLACAVAAPTIAQAETAHSDYDAATVTQKLQNKLRRGEKLPVDVNHDILWSNTDDSSPNYEHITQAPLVARVSAKGGGTETRYFGIIKPEGSKAGFQVEPLPEDATRVANISHLKKPRYGTPLPNSQRLAIKLNSKNQPVAKLTGSNELHKDVVVGKTTHAAPQAATKYGGKRFASTAAINKLYRAKSLSEAEGDIQLFLNQYNLEAAIVEPDIITRLAYQTLSDKDLTRLKSYGATLIDEWSKYPIDWVKHSRLGAIAIVKNLPTGGIRPTAAPDPDSKTMFYAGIDQGNDDYRRRTIHHEFDHFFTYNLFGSYVNPDTTWQALNPAGFQYGNGGASCYQPGNCLVGDHPESGFVSGYATSAIEEDQAEVYASVMTSPGYENLQVWAQTDPNLAQKETYYKQFITKISPQMSGGYFSEINP